MVLARILTPNDFGVVTMVTTFSLLFRSYGLNGFTELIMQREDLTHSLASNLFWLQLCLGTFFSLAFASSGPLIARFYHNQDVTRVAEWTSLTIGLGCLAWIHMGLLQRAMRFRATAFINFTALLVYVTSSIVLAKAGWHYWSLVWASVFQTAAIVLGAWLACPWFPSWPSRVPGTASGFRFAMNVYSHFAFSYLTSNTDNLLVGWRYGAQPLGFYKKAYDLFIMPWTQLMTPISSVAVSALSRVAQDREQFRRYFLQTMSILALLGMGIGTDFALVGKDIIRFLLGPGWEEAGRIFSLFGPGIGVMLLYGMHGWIHLSLGRPERWLRWAVLEFICTASLFLITIRWGPSGVALAWTISYFLLMFPSFWYAGKPIGLRIESLLGTVWKFFAASLVAGFSTSLVLGVLPTIAGASGALGALLRIVLISLLFFSIYLAAVVALHRGTKPLKEAAVLFSELLPMPWLKRENALASGKDKTFLTKSNVAERTVDSVLFTHDTEP